MRKGNKCTLEPSSHFVVFFLFSPFALAFFSCISFFFLYRGARK